MTVTWDNVNKLATVSGGSEGSPNQLGDIFNAVITGGGSANAFASGEVVMFKDMNIALTGVLAVFPNQSMYCDNAAIQWSGSGELMLYYNSRTTFAGSGFYASAGSAIQMGTGCKLKTIWNPEAGLEKPRIVITSSDATTFLGGRLSAGTPVNCTWDVSGLSINLPSTAKVNFATTATSPVLDYIEIADLTGSGGGEVLFYKHTINDLFLRNINRLGIIGNPGASAGPTLNNPVFQFWTTVSRISFNSTAATPALWTFVNPTFPGAAWNGKFYSATDRVQFKYTVNRTFTNEDGTTVGSEVKAQFRSSNSTIGPQVDATSSSGVISATLTSIDSLASTGNSGIETTPTVVTWTEDYHSYSYNEGHLSRLMTSQSLSGAVESTEAMRSIDYTMVSEATAAAYTGISINHGTQTVTVSAVHSYRSIFAYCKQHLRQSGNMQYGDFIRTFDGKGFECDYNMVIDGVTLTGEGWMTITGTNTFTLTGGGSLGDGNFATDLNGTQAPTSSGGVTTEDIQAALDAQGYTIARAAKLDNLDTTVSSRESETDAATRAAADIAEHDATQTAIASLDTATDNAAAVWDYLLADSIVADSFGALLKTNLNATVGSRQSETNANTRYNTLLTEHDATQSAIAALDIQADVLAALTTRGYTAARADNLDNLDAAVSTMETEAAAASRATTNQSEHDATQAAIAGLTVTVDEASIALAVWNTLDTTVFDAGSMGELVVTNLDAAITTRQSETAAATRASDNQTEHDATQAAIAALDFSADVAAALDTQGYTTARAGKLDYLDTPISTLEAESGAATRFATLLGQHDATQAMIDAIDIVADAKTALTEQGYTTTRAPKLDNLDNLTASPPTAADITADILDETLTGHDGADTVGKALRIARDQSTIGANNTQQ